MCFMLPDPSVSLTYRSRISVHFLRARDLGSFSNLSRAFSFNQEQPSLSENAHRVPVHRLEVVLGVECVRKLRPKPSETKRSLPRAISEIPRGADQTLRSPLQSSRLAQGALHAWSLSESATLKGVSYELALPLKRFARSQKARAMT